MLYFLILSCLSCMLSIKVATKKSKVLLSKESMKLRNMGSKYLMLKLLKRENNLITFQQHIWKMKIHIHKLPSLFLWKNNVLTCLKQTIIFPKYSKNFLLLAAKIMVLTLSSHQGDSIPTKLVLICY